ncbi:MAG: DUF1549 domain-containing protein, partial [Lentisphaeria bacterium]|nr:DUF1549 domain-containing protein [Lentisphaeria bacterium]
MKFLLPLIFILGPLFSKPNEESAARKIDAMVKSDLARRKLTPNPVVNDLTYLRRATLAITGRIPSYAEIKAFEAATGETKYSDMVKRLVDSPGYENMIFNFNADLLRLRTHVDGIRNLQPYREWLHAAIKENKPYNEMVMELLTSTGNMHENPATGYYFRDYGMPLDNLALTVQVFLGTRIQCSQCHNHPTQKWKQAEFYKLASLSNTATRANARSDEFLGEMRKNSRKTGDRNPEVLRQVLRNQIFEPLRVRVNFRNSNVRLPHDYAYKDFKPRAMVKPSVPFGPRQKSKKERIESFAMWVVAKNNTNFSKTMVNRIWQVMYGRGLFEPLDDLIPETVITNKRLLTYLTKLFIEMKYDVKGFVSILAKTQLFRQEVKDKLPNVTKVANFQGPYLRRLSAEQIWDSFVYLLRGYEGDFHPYLSRVQAQN